MSLVVASNLTLGFGERKILDDVSFRIAAGDRLGLIGPNGTGKTTLLRVLAGQQSVESGSLQTARDLTIGYLPQDILEVADETILKSVLDAVPGRSSLLESYAAIIRRLDASRDQDEQLALSVELSELQEQVDHLELHFSEHEASRILFGLGFSRTDLERKLHEFSGGWKMRVCLAGILFRKPDLLLLDEPTNHLDVPSVVWFDEFLRQFPGAIVMVSHDRFFLNRQINRAISFEPEGVRYYAGNYDQYRIQRDEEEEILSARSKNIDRERRELERFVERFRAKATKARQAQSRMKMIARLEKDAPPPLKLRRKLSFTFPPVERAANEVVAIRKLVKSFGQLRLFKGISLSVFRGDRVAIVGRNGIGKTTLLKMIAGELSPDGGSIDFGGGVSLRYYAQHHTESLSSFNTILTEVNQEVPTASQTHVRGLLGAFLFPGEDVEKPISVLSGGEKARVALAKLLVRPGNLLLMDEPTNHLDVDSSEAMAKALAAFEGTLLFVSHNRSFVDHLATRVWDLTPEGIVDYPGNLERYLEHLAIQRQEKQATPAIKALAGTVQGTFQATALERPQPGKAAQTRTPPVNTQAAKPTSAPKQEKKKPPQQSTVPGGDWHQKKEEKRQRDQHDREQSRQIATLKKKIIVLEKEIAELEEAVTGREKELAQPALYQVPERFNVLMKDYTRYKSKLDQSLSTWEKTVEELDRVEKTTNKHGSPKP